MSTCQAIVYRHCSNEVGCGSRNDRSCRYLHSLSSNPACAWGPCGAVKGSKEWQPICDGINAIEIKGPCNAVLARESSGEKPYRRTFSSGFHGLWKIFEDGVHICENAAAIKFSCGGKDISFVFFCLFFK